MEALPKALPSAMPDNRRTYSRWRFRRMTDDFTVEALPSSGRSAKVESESVRKTSAIVIGFSSLPAIFAVFCSAASVLQCSNSLKTVRWMASTRVFTGYSNAIIDFSLPQ